MNWNDYKICGDYTEIYIKRRNGEVLTAIIDTEDLAKVQALQRRLCVRPKDKDYNSLSYYVKFVGKPYTYLHRFIMDTSDDKVVDHINGNQLDNRKSNLRNVDNNINMKNRHGSQSNSKTNVRGVSYEKQRNKWIVRIRANKETIFFGRFNDFDSAKQASEEVYEKLI